MISKNLIVGPDATVGVSGPISFAYPSGTGIGLSGSDANDVCMAGFS